MGRERDRPRALTAPARLPVEREFSAGGLVYRLRGGAWWVVLGARRPLERRALAWSIPKGHVEPGERMAEAALREVREETGLVAVIEGTLGEIRYWYARKDASGHAVRISKRVRFYLMRHEGGRFADRDAELDAVRWFPLGDAIAQVAYANERVLIERARDMLAGPRPA